MGAENTSKQANRSFCCGWLFFCKYFHIIYLCMASLALRCCMFSGCGTWASHCGGFSRRGAQALGTVSSVAETHRLSCLVAYEILALRPEMEPTSPALEGRFLTTRPPGKSQSSSILKAKRLRIRDKKTEGLVEASVGYIYHKLSCPPRSPV